MVEVAIEDEVRIREIEGQYLLLVWVLFLQDIPNVRVKIVSLHPAIKVVDVRRKAMDLAVQIEDFREPRENHRFRLFAFHDQEDFGLTRHGKRHYGTFFLDYELPLFPCRWNRIGS